MEGVRSKKIKKRNKISPIKRKKARKKEAGAAANEKKYVTV